MEQNIKRAVFLLCAAVLLTACGSKGQDIDTDKADVRTETDEQQTDGQQEDEARPYILTFSGQTTDGKTLTSDIFADSRLTMVNVWATFCGPCINEMPDLGAISSSYDPSDLQLIGIVSDVMEEDDALLDTAKELIEETGADYPHLLLNKELYTDLVGASDSVPTTYFFDRDGALLGYLVGARSKEDWKEIIDELLAGLEG